MIQSEEGRLRCERAIVGGRAIEAIDVLKIEFFLIYNKNEIFVIVFCFFDDEFIGPEIYFP